MPRFNGTLVNLRARQDDAQVHFEVTPKGFDSACLAGVTLDYSGEADLVALRRACAAFNAEIAKAKRTAPSSEAA